jgi:hypothetical protein
MVVDESVERVREAGERLPARYGLDGLVGYLQAMDRQRRHGRKRGPKGKNKPRKSRSQPVK